MNPEKQIFVTNFAGEKVSYPEDKIKKIPAKETDKTYKINVYPQTTNPDPKAVEMMGGELHQNPRIRPKKVDQGS